jgi:hypothetical protein
MSRARATFRRRDLQATVEAAQAAGLQIDRVEVDKDGKITVITGKPDSNRPNPWDGALMEAGGKK